MHAAADTEYDWSFYGNLVGAYFASHPAIQQANVKVEDRAHPATAHLPQTWTRTDEWYNYQTNPRSTARVLATLDESSYSGGDDGRRPSDLLVQDVSTAAGRSTPAAGTPRRPTPRRRSAPTCSAASGTRPAGPRPTAGPETGYTALYNGSTTGWSQAGPGSFTNADATLTSVGGMGLLWYSAKQFTNYSLKLDWRMTGDDNSGVFIGFPTVDATRGSRVNNGYEIQIDATDAADRTTGAIYSFKSADMAARDAALNPPGEWNTYELLVEGERVQVFLNGAKINDFTNTDPAASSPATSASRTTAPATTSSFRNIRIKELGGTRRPATSPSQAEAFSSANGVSAFTKAGANGGQTLGYIDPGDWAGVPRVST